VHYKPEQNKKLIYQLYAAATLSSIKELAVSVGSEFRRTRPSFQVVARRRNT